MPTTQTGRKAIYLSASLIPGMFFVGQVTSSFLKQTNPDNVDVNQGLAYLRPILTASFITGLVIFTSAVLLLVQARRIGDTYQAAIAAKLLGIQLTLIMLLAIADAIVAALI